MPNKQADTPTKAEVRGAKKMLDFLERDGRYSDPQKLETVKECLGLSNKSQVSRICSSKERRHYEPGEDPRGGHRGDEENRLSPEKVKDAAAVIEGNDYEGHDLDSGSPRNEANLPDISDRTLRRRLKEDEDIGGGFRSQSRTESS